MKVREFENNEWESIYEVVIVVIFWWVSQAEALGHPL